MGEEGEESENFSADEILLGSALQGDVEGIEYALEHGANLGARDGEGNSALLLAVSCGHKKAAKHLLRLGIPINDVNEFGEGVLHMCFGSGMAELGTYLIEHGADTAAVTVGSPPQSLTPTQDTLDPEGVLTFDA
jgi:ankyrin repeat protein